LATAAYVRTRELTIFAQDPSVRDENGHIIRAKITIPAERLDRGPRGYRVHCIDFDTTTNTYYDTGIDDFDDVYADKSDEELLADPSFHCQNVYALVMHTLSRFEHALGRRVSWGFYGHQLQIAPHAFREANAFYSEKDHSLLFGYVPVEDGTVFTCLSHDVVVHETTHALIDGLRTRYTDPSSPDQAAFHEGFADVVALLSVFSLQAIPQFLLDRKLRGQGRIPVANLSAEILRNAIGKLAEELGGVLKGVRGEPLRRSMQDLPPNRDYLADEEFEEPHRRGELFVAAIMNAFIDLWAAEIERLGDDQTRTIDRDKVVEEGARLADALLTSSIRALDYAPPVDVTFSDYLSAFLTADHEMRGETLLRDTVRASFLAYGIKPASAPKGTGRWAGIPKALRYERVHFEPMQRDADEVFHFVWENRDQDHLDLLQQGYTRVLSVRPCMRQGPDGFILRETVAEYLQVIKLRAGDLSSIRTRKKKKRIVIRKPTGMPDEQELFLYGGGTLIFDEYGRLKYHVYTSTVSAKQTDRLDYLWRNGFYSTLQIPQLHFARMHQLRATGTELAFDQLSSSQLTEVW
jgi:hypothetical protein